MIIKVLGSGCNKCDKVYKMLEEIQDKNGLEFKIIKVEDLKSIVSYGIMTTPTLIINDDVLFKGVVPNKKKLIKEIETRL
jgi:small redox-active disulfide protein 2